MIGIDTNVLVRYIMQDDAAQAERATRLIEDLSVADGGWISIVTVAELTWVLGASYKLDRSQIAVALETLLRTQEIVVDQADTVWQALRRYRSSNADLADCLVACSATAAGCSQTITFDRGAARAAGMTLV